MEGTLYKWTNYIFGWRERYFVLKGCVVHYYYKKGDQPRGRIHLSVCKINSQPNDAKIELDSGISVLYLKAESIELKELWVKALKAAKKEAENKTIKENQNLTSLANTPVPLVEKNFNSLNYNSVQARIEMNEVYPNNYNTYRSTIDEDKLLKKINSLSTAVNSLENNNENLNKYFRAGRAGRRQ